MRSKNKSDSTGRTALPKQIKKRDGLLVPFTGKKIERAVEGAAYEVLGDRHQASTVARRVKNRVLEKLLKLFPDKVPSVESIQDLVEDRQFSCVVC